MLSMDLKSTGITWVGNMYQKLEAMCQEVCQDVDSIMVQDTTKYVESQVQTVGVNVRKFCNGVMQDMLSSSACSVKGPVSDLSLVYDMDVSMYEKSKKGSEECHASEKPSLTAELKTIFSEGEDLSAISSNDVPQDVNHGESVDVTMSIEVPEYTCSEVTGENHNSMSNLAASIASLPSTFSSESVVPIVSHDSKLLECQSILSNSALSTDANGICMSHEKLLPVSCTEIEHEEDEESAVLLEPLVTSESAVTTGLDSSGWLEACKDNNASEPNTETIEQFEDVKVEESCIHVEKNGHCSISHQEGKNRSYKKKIRDAFASKLQTAKKHDDEQFAVWYNDMDMETKLRGGISSSFTLVDNLDPKKLSSQDFSESDWELL